MKKPLKVAHRNHTLGELIVAVSSHSRNDRETLAAVVDLLESGTCDSAPASAKFAHG